MEMAVRGAIDDAVSILGWGEPSELVASRRRRSGDARQIVLADRAIGTQTKSPVRQKLLLANIKGKILERFNQEGSLILGDNSVGQDFAGLAYDDRNLSPITVDRPAIVTPKS